MDSLSIVGSIAGLVGLAKSAVEAMRASYKIDQRYIVLQPHLRKFEAATVLLETIGKHLPTNAVVPGTDFCLDLCMESQKEVEAMAYQALGKSGPSNVIKTLWTADRIHALVGRLSEAVDRFMGAVELLRSFAQE